MGRPHSELERGRRSYADRSWLTAYESLSAADRTTTMRAEDLELLARSAYMLGRDNDYVDALVRAHRAHLASGSTPAATRCAIWIGHNMLFGGQAAHAGGWFARAERLHGRVERDCVERGYMLIPVWLGQMMTGDHEAGRATAARAEEIGERFGDAELVWLARDDQARALLRLGRVDEGLRLVEEILVAAEADELSPLVTGILYCNTISFCRDAYQLRHARAWTEALTRWCERQPEMVAHNGFCLVHRAEVLQLTGAWDQALEEARHAADRFTQGVLNKIACGQAHYLQGEIHRLRGDVAGAEDAFAEASRWGFEPQPGMALLRLAQGNTDAAAASIRRAIGETTEPPSRGELLPAYVEIMLAEGDFEAAAGGVRELERVAGDQGNEVLDAMSAQARGALALAEGDAANALPALRRAMSVWQELDAAYDVARVRMLLALACRNLGDEDAATLDLQAARGIFADLGAKPDLERIEDVLPRGDAPEDAHGLTRREVEVLGLVAAGKSNREIANELVISEHTVARHLQNIFVKLDVSSRTAAGAFAFEHDLV